MANLAPPITRPFDWIAGAAKSRAATHEMLRLLKTRATHGVLVGLLIDVQYWLQMAPSLSEQPRALLEVFAGMVVRNVWFWIVGFVTIAIIQTKLAPGRTRTVALVFCTLAWAGVFEFLLLWPHTYIVVELGLATPTSMVMQGLWTNVTYLLLAVWYCESSDRAGRSAAALRQRELVRRGAERWLLELRLGSLQARLDPHVLFETMDEAVRLYRSRPTAAERLLDALIEYLRRALPRLHQAQSTLGQEVALAFAFARVLSTRNSAPLEVEAVVEPEVGNARFPPMVVQPLCESLARLALTSGEPARICIFAAREQDCVRLYLSAQPVQSPPSHERLADIRHTLLTMFGPVARMDAIGPTVGVLHVVVEVPYDAAPRIDS